MSNLLNEAIIDAKALKEAALKNAEAAVIKKYSAEVKQTLDTLLEQEDAAPMGAAPEGAPADLGAEPAPEADPMADLGMEPELGGEEDLGGEAGEDLAGDEGAEDAGALLAAPGKRDVDSYLTPRSKGKRYKPVKLDKRFQGARRRSYSNVDGYKDLKTLSKGIYENLDSTYKEDEEKLFQTNFELKQLIENLENSKKAENDKE